MDDERLTARLRGLEAPIQPRERFVTDLHDELAARLGFEAIERSAIAGRGVAPGRTGSPVVMRRVALLAAAALLLALLAANAAAIGALVSRLLASESLLDTVLASGRIEVVVTAGAPQAMTPANGIDGFDIDVAGALAERLGVRADVTVSTTAEMLAAPGDRWQAAMPGAIDPAAATDLLMTRPYYRWPLYIIAAPDSSAADGLLPGASVCVVAGSPGSVWASGVPTGPTLEVLTAAPALTVESAPDEATCVDRVEAGEVDAMVSTALLPADLPASGGLVLVRPDPVAQEPRVLAVSADMPGAGQLRDALDAVIEELRRDGTLADLARARFGTDAVVEAP